MVCLRVRTSGNFQTHRCRRRLVIMAAVECRNTRRFRGRKLEVEGERRDDAFFCRRSRERTRVASTSKDQGAASILPQESNVSEFLKKIPLWFGSVSEPD